MVQETICPKCRKPKEGKTASLTQWINVCKCDTVFEQSSSTEPTCNDCGRRIGEARQGTITQWVLRSDYCSCKLPNIAGSASSTNDEDSKEPGPDEAELPLDGDAFPVDRYKPVKVTGQGGSGTVYLSRDRLLGKLVAIKVLRFKETESLVAFQNEAKTTSKLNHPNIVKVFDFGVTGGGTPYMVMEHISSQSLERLIAQDGALKTSLALSIMSQIADALAYAHENHILHRDLKPGNILIVEEQGRLRAKLIDFGVAKLQESERDTLRINNTTLVGTPAYMSPDQPRGLKYTEQSEIYSLGCVLFEALSGRPPFVVDSPLETIARHAKDPVPRLDEHSSSDGETTGALNELIKKCLDKEPDNRFESSSALKHAIDAINVSGSSTETNSPRPGTASGAAKPLEKNPIVPFAIFFILAIVAVFAMAFLQPRSQKTKAAKAQKVQQVHRESSTQREVFEFSKNGSSCRVAGVAYDEDFEWLADNKAGVLTELVVGGWQTSTPQDAFTERGYLAIAKLKELKILHLSNCAVPLTDRSFEEIAALKNLHTLYLVQSEITDSQLQYLKDSPVETLYLSDATIGDEAMEHVSKLKNLKEVSISGTRVGDRGLAHLAALKLKVLYMDTNPATSQGLKQISKISTIEKLSLRDLPVDSGVIKSFANLKLNQLIVAHATSFDDDCLRLTVKQWPNIDFLTISSTKVTPAGLVELEKLKNISTLEIAELDLHDKDLEFLRRIPSLIFVCLDLNPITDAGLKELAKIGNIQQLQLFSCNEIGRDGLAALTAAGKQFRCNTRTGDTKGVEDFMDGMLAQ